MNNEIDVISLHLNKAEKLVTLKKFEEAVTELDAILKIDPLNIKALALKGKIFVAQERYQEAILVTDEITRINPRNIIALNVKATCLYLLERYQESIELCDGVLEAYPDDVGSHKIKSWSLRDMKDYQSLAKHLDIKGFDSEKIERLVNSRLEPKKTEPIAEKNPNIKKTPKLSMIWIIIILVLIFLVYSMGKNSNKVLTPQEQKEESARCFKLTGADCPPYSAN